MFTRLSAWVLTIKCREKKARKLPNIGVVFAQNKIPHRQNGTDVTTERRLFGEGAADQQTTSSADPSSSTTTN
mgnify:CR=1 FL=1